MWLNVLNCCGTGEGVFGCGGGKEVWRGGLGGCGEVCEDVGRDEGKCGGVRGR